MNQLTKQCINLILDKSIDNAIEYSDPRDVIAFLLVHGGKGLSQETQEELLNRVYDEYTDEFLDSEQGKSDDVPERTRLEHWISLQRPYNWISRV